MVQEAETVALELELVSCGTCDTVFISSERRQTCPACGGEAVGPYLEFVATPDGPRLKNGAAQVLAGAAPPSPAPESPAALADGDAPAEEGTATSIGRIPVTDMLPMAVESFLRGREATEDDIRGMLLDLGADPDVVATTVGRLIAVRDTLASLEPSPPESEGEAAAEEAPEEAPAPEAGGGEAEEPA